MRSTALLLALLVTIGSGLPSAEAGPSAAIEARVDELVFKHYLDGIQYVAAHELGAAAVPHLLELLDDPQHKEFWVNITATLGFIEDSSAVAPLIYTIF